MRNVVDRVTHAETADGTKVSFEVVHANMAAHKSLGIPVRCAFVGLYEPGELVRGFGLVLRIVERRGYVGGAWEYYVEALD